MNTTPIVRCPRPDCEHPIDSHSSFADRTVGVCGHDGCNCRMTPNLIAVAHLFGGLTPTPDVPRSVSRQPDGSWS